MTDRPGEGYLQRQSDWLRSYLRARSGEPVHELSPELVAAIILENDRPETMVLQHTFPWSTGLVVVAANVGFNGKLQINNPANSGIIVVVQGLKIVGKPTAGLLRFTLNGALGTTPAPNISLDSRARIVAAQPIVASENRISNTTGMNGVIFDLVSVTVALGDGSSEVLKTRPVILTPGHTAEIWNQTTNEACNFFGWGYERPLESTELVNR